MRQYLVYCLLVYLLIHVVAIFLPPKSRRICSTTILFIFGQFPILLNWSVIIFFSLIVIIAHWFWVLWYWYMSKMIFEMSKRNSKVNRINKLQNKKICMMNGMPHAPWIHYTTHQRLNLFQMNINKTKMFSNWAKIHSAHKAYHNSNISTS